MATIHTPISIQRDGDTYGSKVSEQSGKNYVVLFLSQFHTLQYKPKPSQQLLGKDPAPVSKHFSIFDADIASVYSI